MVFRASSEGDHTGAFRMTVSGQRGHRATPTTVPSTDIECQYTPRASSVLMVVYRGAMTVLSR